MDPSCKEDELAICYLNGSDEQRREIAADIAAIPTPRYAKIGVGLLMGIFVLITITFDYLTVGLMASGMELDRTVIGIVNSAGAIGVWKVWVFYQASKPSVPDLLMRFQARHPNHPALQRLQAGQSGLGNAGRLSRKELEEFARRNPPSTN